MRFGALVALLCALGASEARAQSRWSSRLVGPHAREQLASPEAERRLAAVRQLARRGEPHQSVQALLALLQSEEDARVREAAYDALARRGDEAALEPLAAWLGDDEQSSRGHRAQALRTIGAIGSERAIRILVEWLGIADAGDVAAEALAWIGPPAVPHLLRALSTPIATARAARALGQIGDARATAPLVSRLRGALPAARIAIIDALAAIGDERAAPAVTRYLEDADPNVVAATLRALASIGGADQAEPVAALADRGTSEQRAAALEALIVIAPSAAAPRALSALTEVEQTPLLRRAAIDGLLSHPGRETIEPLRELLHDEVVADHAAEALSRVERGLGVPALLEAARADEERRFDRALALGVRRHGDQLPEALTRAVGAHLDAGALPVRCLARRVDGALRDRLLSDLGGDDPTLRAQAASCALLLGDEAAFLRDPVAAALRREEDPMAFRALALAALRSGAAIDPAQIDARWWDAATAPEALWLTAANLSRAAPRTRTRARRSMRRLLRSPDPRARAGAALALAMASERRAWRALVAATEDEHDAVRLAAARALASLGVEEAGERLEARIRVERDRDVREALRLAVRAPEERSPPPHVPGDEILYVRVSTAPGLQLSASRLAVDVMLTDGRWLRVSSFEDGTVLLPSIPAGLAEVQVRLDP